jgi:hypothetical protein
VSQYEEKVVNGLPLLACDPLAVGHWRHSVSMRHRIVIWASVGFLVACCWIVYSFVTPPDYLSASMRNPIVEAAVITSCPISLAGRYFPLRLSVPEILTP